MLNEGDQLDEYQIRRKLAQGGNAEVFVAFDTQLRREVALKVLPEASAKVPDSLARFEQEACILAAINHPCIPVIYCSKVTSGIPYIVTELLTGQTLRQKLIGYTLHIGEILRYARRIADGLAAAHTKGVLHRDLSSQNIFVTKTDQVKILDFGLAKLTAAWEARPDEQTWEHIPTSGQASVLGTLGYMSPEQACGRELDGRSDIFSLGVIVFEMLYGRRPFRGDTFTEVKNSILNSNPKELFPGRAFQPIQSVVRRCLEKDPEARFQSASDLAFLLGLLLQNQGEPLGQDDDLWSGQQAG